MRYLHDLPLLHVPFEFATCISAGSANTLAREAETRLVVFAVKFIAVGREFRMRAEMQRTFVYAWHAHVSDQLAACLYARHTHMWVL